MNTDLKEKELKIFRKVLMDHSFNKDGYEYHFLSVEPDEKGCPALVPQVEVSRLRPCIRRSRVAERGP